MPRYDDLLKEAYHFAKQNQFGPALQKFREAAVLRPLEQEPLIQMATLFEELGDMQGSVHLLEKAVSLDETSAYAIFLLGLAYYSSDDHPRATKCLRHAIALVEQGTTEVRSLLDTEDPENEDLIRRQLGSLDETADIARELLNEIDQSANAAPPPSPDVVRRVATPRVGILMALWQRRTLSNVVMNHYQELKKQLAGIMELELWAVGSEGAESRRSAESNGFMYVEHPNQPLGAKWNAGLRAMRTVDVDAVVIVGSDDLLNEAYFTRLAELLDQGCVFAGLEDMYVFDLETLRVAHWPGYGERSGRRGESIGLGRCYHRSLLDEIGWTLWDDRLENSLDRSAFQRVAGHLSGKRKTALINGRREGVIAIDVKSGENLWSMNDVVATLENAEYFGAAGFLSEHFSKSMARDLLSLSDEARHVAQLLNGREEVPHIVNPQASMAAAS